MKKTNWEYIDTINDGGRLPADGYVIVINDVEDVPNREYLYIVFDIAEGPYKGHYSDDWGKRNEWAHRFTKSYSEKAQGFFKQFLDCLEKSNAGFKISEWQEKSDEREFIGLEVGVIFQEREYEGNDGSIKTALDAAKIVTADTIRRGDFKKLDKKTIERTASIYNDLPF